MKVFLFSRFVYAFLLTTLITIPPLYSKAIIFDLGDTLIKRDTGKIAGKIGYWAGFWMWLENGHKTKNRIGDLLMDVLSDGTETKKEGPIPLDIDSRVMPHIMCDWFMGKVTSDQALEYSLKRVEKYPFKLKREKAIIRATLKWMFNPKTFGESMIPIPDAMTLLEKLSTMKDKSGKRIHKLYIISNYDVDSFNYLLYKRPEVFKFFSSKNMEISGKVKNMKPYYSMFNNFMKKHNLKPEECIFIDDQEENVSSARTCGMKAIRVVNHNYEPVLKQLNRLGVAV